jgi:cytochrome c-type biogenesis protein CcmH/NrfG
LANPAFFLQLGNARLLTDDLAGAILAYHQGLTLAPTDRDLQAALDHARTQVAYPAGGFARSASPRSSPASRPFS